MSDIKSRNKGSGQVQIADGVIAVIAGTAALEAEGIAGMAGNFAGEIIEKLGRKNFSKGVNINVEDKSVVINLNLIVKFGFKINETALDVQKRVKTAVETMTGLSVSSVNVNVTGIDFESDSE